MLQYTGRSRAGQNGRRALTATQPAATALSFVPYLPTIPWWTPNRLMTMFLQGSIHKFDLASILQFLAQHTCTGILEVRDFDEYGFIYLVEGRVEGISLPITDQKLGSRLVKAGMLTEQKLSEILIEESSLSKEEKKAKPLGQRLLDKGYIPKTRCATSWPSRRSTRSSRWRTGRTASSNTTSPRRCPTSRSASRRTCRRSCSTPIGESTKAKSLSTAKTVVEDEVCFGCPVVEECTEDIKAKWLKPDVCLWRRMGAVMDDDYERVQDAQLLYKSRESNAKPQLETALDSDGTLDLEE